MSMMSMIPAEKKDGEIEIQSYITYFKKSMVWLTWLTQPVNKRVSKF
jgi:hypothetical protein